MNPGGMMRHTIHVAEPVGVSKSATLAYGVPAPRRARVQYNVVVKRGAGGEEERRDVVYTEEPIHPQARVWLPTADITNASEARQPRPTSASSTPDGSATLCRTEF